MAIASGRQPGQRSRTPESAFAADLKRIYTAADQDAAADELTAFAEKWDQRFPTISRSWPEHWEHVTPFLAFPPDLRRIVYTTNTIETPNRQIRKSRPR